MIEKLTKLFPFWAILFSIISYYYPGIFTRLGSAIVPLLMIIMLGMGMTLTWQNFKDVFKTPRAILIGMFLQYGLMPVTAFLIARAFSLSPELLAGAVLVSCAPDGTASSVVTYLAKGNVALSVTLTVTSTLLGVIVTPALTYLFVNQYIEVKFWEMMLSVLQIALVPVLAGTIVNSVAGAKLERIRNVFPFISTLAIILIIAIVVALNRDRISEVNIDVLSVVILMNLAGLFLGYFIPKLAKHDESTCRTLSIEMGMQNSGLAVALAIKYFTPLAALPGAIFGIWHNISGSIMAAYWRKEK